MIYHKQVSVGAFLKKGEDIKDGDIVVIASEGKQVEGQYGIQDIFLIKLKDGKEGNISLNATSLNCLIDAYGEDSKNWIGKSAKVWAILSNVQGKMTKVYYFTHPEATIDDSGTFSIPNQQTPNEQNLDDEIKTEDLPF